MLIIAAMYESYFFFKDSIYYTDLVFILCTLGTFTAYPIFVIGLMNCPYSITRERRVRLKLLQIIEENGFYNKNSESKKINSSMIIKFNLYSSGLVLKVYPDGAKYASKMNDLTRIFETKFSMTVVSVENDSPDHTTYILEDTSDNYIDATKVFGNLNE